jgi:hypothetical protein
MLKFSLPQKSRAIYLKLDLSLGITYAQTAGATSDSEKAVLNWRRAQMAHDTVSHLSTQMELSGEELGEIRDGLQELETLLQRRPAA